MLKILHKGFQANLPLDQTGFTGDVQHDSELDYTRSLVGGRFVAMTDKGLCLADGGNVKQHCVGILVNDAAGYFYENKPAIASGLAAVSVGNQMVITDQIAPGITIAVGDKLYVGTGDNKGLITNKAPVDGSDSVGVAITAASAASPELTMLAFT